MKKIIPLSLVIIFVLTMIGCTQAPNDTILRTHNTTEEIYNETTEITVEADTNITENIDDPIESKDNALQTDESAETAQFNDENTVLAHGNSMIWETFGSLKETMSFFEATLKPNSNKGEWDEYKFRRLEGLGEDYFDHMVEFNKETGEYILYYKSEKTGIRLGLSFFEDGEKTETIFKEYIYAKTYEGLLENDLVFDVNKSEVDFKYGTGYECVYSTKKKTGLKNIYNEYTEEKTGIEYILLARYDNDGTHRSSRLMVVDGDGSFEMTLFDAPNFTMEDAIKLRSAVIE